MKLIIAINKLGYIGLNGGLPWRCPADLAHFKKMTLNQKLIVGRGTYESMPKLSQRELLVVGKNHLSLEEALKGNPNWVIGGKRLYEALMGKCDEAHISIINDYTQGDTLAPSFDTFVGKKFYYEF